MKKSISELITMFFGGTSKEKFKRLIILLALIGLIGMLMLNVQCGYDKTRGFHFEWVKAAEIEIKKGGE